MPKLSRLRRSPALHAKRLASTEKPPTAEVFIFLLPLGLSRGWKHHGGRAGGRAGGRVGGWVGVHPVTVIHGGSWHTEVFWWRLSSVPVALQSSAILGRSPGRSSFVVGLGPRRWHHGNETRPPYGSGGFPLGDGRFVGHGQERWLALVDVLLQPGACRVETLCQHEPNRTW